MELSMSSTEEKYLDKIGQLETKVNELEKDLEVGGKMFENQTEKLNKAKELIRLFLLRENSWHEQKYSLSELLKMGEEILKED